MGMCKWFLKDATKFKMAARGQLHFLCAQKLQKFKSEIIQILLSHMEMCRWLYQGSTVIQNGRHRLTLIYGGRKNSKNCLVIFF